MKHTRFLLVAAVGLVALTTQAFAHDGGGWGSGGGHGDSGGSGHGEGGRGYSGGWGHGGGRGYGGGWRHGGWGYGRGWGYGWGGVGLGFYGAEAYYDAPYYDGAYYGNPVVVDHGSVEIDVQRALAHLGFYGGPVDGAIGPKTRAAIRAYQADQGLPVTGRIDVPLLRSLHLY